MAGLVYLMDSYSLMEIKGGVYSYVNNLLKPTLRVSVLFAVPANLNRRVHAVDVRRGLALIVSIVRRARLHVADDVFSTVPRIALAWTGTDV